MSDQGDEVVLSNTRKHLANEVYRTGASGVQVCTLRCTCGEWETSDGNMREKRAAHRAHRVIMGEAVRPLKDRDAERRAEELERERAMDELHRLRKAAHMVRRIHYPEGGAWGDMWCYTCRSISGWPCDTIKALDGDEVETWYPGAPPATPEEVAAVVARLREG